MAGKMRYPGKGSKVPKKKPAAAGKGPRVKRGTKGMKRAGRRY